MNDLTGKEWLQYSFSIWRDFKKTTEERELKHPASYPVVLCERLIRTFSKKGSNVLDPFSGIGSSMVACKNLGNKGVGIDLSSNFCDITKKRIGDYRDVKIINGDSFTVLKELKENSFDLCITSPPYWDILNMKRSADGKDSVNYSESINDIGNIKKYDDFANSLKKLFSEVYRVLNTNSYCIVNVMDIRKKNKFYPLHSDLATSLKEIGFIYDDLIIWDRQNEYNNMRPLGYPYKFRINKVHEYLLIFIKE